MKLLAVNYGFFRNIIKELTKILIIAAIIPNFMFFTFYLSAICNDYGTLTLSLLVWIRGILIFAIPVVMIISIELTFYKKFKILHSVLRIIAVILNAHALIVLIWFEQDPLDYLALYLIYYAFAVGNLVVLALTFIKQKENTEVLY
ncbi:MAG: hypothetical protein AMJ75_03805 [Phycisphaerae bacterium SM1_79]|nr:MAG: hypothetical protein AMJ75_03805 [Phycisphaerae bacterium SM1_79]